jgi:hypothetical protein
MVGKSLIESGPNSWRIIQIIETTIYRTLGSSLRRGKEYIWSILFKLDEERPEVLRRMAGQILQRFDVEAVILNA